MPVVALGPLDILLIAAMVLLSAYATLELVKVLAHLLRNLPVVGGWVADHLVSLADSVTNWVTAKLWGSAVGMAGVFTDVWGWLSASADQLAQLASVTAVTVERIVRVQIPAAVDDVQAWAHDRIAAARDYASSLVDAAATDLRGRIAAARDFAAAITATLRTDAWSWFNQARAEAAAATAAAAGVAAAGIAAARAEALSLFHTAEAEAAHALAATEHDLAASIGAVDARATAGVHEAEDLARALSQAAVHDAGVITDLVGVKALEPVWSDLTDAAGAIAGDLVPDLAGLEDLLKGLEGASLTGLAGVLSGLGVLSLTQALALEKCILPNCRNLSGLGQFLQALLGDVEDAALLAFIIMMATEPTRAAAVIDDVAGPIVSGTTTGLRDLIGV